MGEAPRAIRLVQGAVLADGPVHRADEARRLKWAARLALARPQVVEAQANVLARRQVRAAGAAHLLHRRLPVADDGRRRVALAQGAPVKRRWQEITPPTTAAVDTAIASALTGALAGT